MYDDLGPYPNYSKAVDFTTDWALEYGFNEKFAEDFKSFLFEMIKEEIGTKLLVEDFRNRDSLRQHFNKHCIKGKNHSMIVYKFDNVKDYSDYENKVRNYPIDCVISSLESDELVYKSFDKLSRGNYTIVLNDLYDEQEERNYSILFHSFCNDYVLNNKFSVNHGLPNCMDVCVINTDTEYTLTLFPRSINTIKTYVDNQLVKFK